MCNHACMTKFPLCELSEELVQLIRDHTQTMFAVESGFNMLLRFPGNGSTVVPYVIRYELLLKKRNLSKTPEIQVTLKRFLNPAFMHSNFFKECDKRTQELLVDHSKEIIFSSVSAVRLEIRHHMPGQFEEFIQFLCIKNATENVCRTPFWCKIERDTIEEVREKLKFKFHMEFA